MLLIRRKFQHLSLLEIARVLHRGRHSTALRAIEQARQRELDEPSFRLQVEQLMKGMRAA
jgi:chromosomal replication initiation ATPase DnaA